jgi:hypothetical protein
MAHERPSPDHDSPLLLNNVVAPLLPNFGLVPLKLLYASRSLCNNDHEHSGEDAKEKREEQCQEQREIGKIEDIPIFKYHQN